MKEQRLKHSSVSGHPAMTGRDDRYEGKVAVLESLDDLDLVADWAAEA